MIDPEIAMQLYDPAIKKRRGGHIPYRHKFATDEEMGRIDLTEQKKAWKSFLKKKKAGVYDPASKTQHKGSWLDFVKAHKDIRLPSGLLDLKAISKLWYASKALDPKSKEERHKIWVAERLAQQEKEEKEWQKTHLYCPKCGHKADTMWAKAGEACSKCKTPLKAYFYDPGWNAGRKNTLWNRVNRYARSSSDDVRSHLRRTYDNENKGSWLDFVKQHKDMRTAKGLLDLKAISKLWKEEKAKGYDPGKHTQWGQVQKHRRRARYTSTVDDYSPVRKHWRRLFDLLDTKTRPPVKWFYAMLKGIKHGSDVANPAAIVSSIWQRLSPSKRAEIKAKEARGGTFKYDLPLPEDMQTRGTGTLRIVKPFKLAEVQVNLSVKDYLHALKSGLFSRMKRGDGTTALVKRCKSDKGNCNIFLDQ